MANRETLISNLHGGERLGISTLGKNSTVQTVGKAQRQQQEDARPEETDLGNLG